ncbi:DUF775 domain protein [Tothia fuscella]|uniref:DUF775 domain protein n=1 Tax=Tothia fuscella TaxID=1048955 RepID=A0A9P4NJD8_9PEZI|nr:DUF775 domain protein [Tothia fuscella]
MFGVIISGRPVLTTFDTISPTQAQLTIPTFPPFGHIVVFMLPGATLPEGQSAAVYIRIPPSYEFKLWGELSNTKQSAIFKIRNTSSGNGGNNLGAVDMDAMIDEDAQAKQMGGSVEPVTIGISLEPTVQLEANITAQKAAATASVTGLELVRHTPGAVASQVSTKVLAQRIIANAFNFLASFSSAGSGGNEVVPLKSFQEWWKKFERKVEMDPTFLERGDV